MTPRVDAARAGYAFGNRFVNVVLRLPGRPPLTSAGRCGGMSYSVLDHLAAGRDVPSWPAGLFAPDRVPPDGHLVADHLRARQLDSFRSLSALRFLVWSALPDADVGPLRGVRSRTRRELPRVLRALADGRPVVLGLVVARHVLRSGDNHQVVATGFTRDAGGPVLTLLDPNTPHRDVTLRETPEGWVASNGRTWRGFFLHAYRPRTPPPLPGASRRPGRRVRAGSPLRLVHVRTGRVLVVDGDRPALAASGPTTWLPAAATGDPDPAHGADALLTDRDRVRLVASSPDAAPSRGGPALTADADGAVALTAGAGTWRVVVDGGGPWREGSRVRLLHDATGALLAGTGARATATFRPDATTWWTVGDTP